MPRSWDWATLSVQLRGCLQWSTRQMQHGNESIMVMVFDTAAESFGLMRAPVVHHLIDRVDLFEMDAMLGMFSFNRGDMTADIWVLQDYEKVRVRCESLDDDEYWDVVVVPGDGELIVLVKLAEWLLQVDMDGKLVANFHRQCVWPTQFQLKQSLIPHSFFPTLEGYVVNEVPFL
ncbi:hypothetical protein TRIUR3_02630 [Triticum urartu]|uniref:Uncharacterized protein n=1 Tax=Triticum urartu TaxID=4572 RepID=M7YZF2_TRIUA|nr:hypothetical protein TRIUR3_02630 [Triticum urartu]